MTNAESLLLKALRVIDAKLGAGSARNSGLCSWVNRELGAMWEDGVDATVFERADEMYCLMLERWPERSGNDWHPVPCPEEYLKAHCPEVFEDTDCADNPERCAAVAYDYLPIHLFYDPDSPYGAARLRLLAWLIAELEKQQ